MDLIIEASFDLVASLSGLFKLFVSELAKEESTAPRWSTESCKATIEPMMSW